MFANDTQVGADGALNTSVALVSGSQVGGGTLTNNGNGTFTLVPLAGQTGVVTFQYTITDGDGDTATATATINLLGDSVPQVVNVVAAVDDDGLAGSNAAVSATDIDANVGDLDGAASSEATFRGQLSVGFGGDTGTVSFANLAGSFVQVGSERIALSWSGTTLTGSVAATDALNVAQARSGTPLFTVTLSPSGAYTVTLLDNVLHATGGNETSAPVVELNYVATDSDGDSDATGKLSITFNDDVPSAVAPVAATVINGAGAPVTQSLDIDGTLANNYGADGGTIRFAPALNGANSGLTSNFAPIIYTLVDDLTLVGKAGVTTVFTITLDPATSKYIVDMDGRIDSTSTIDFNNGAYNFVGGNNSWSEFIPLAESVSTPIDNNSKDLLLTPSISGAPNGSINSTATAGGIGSGASVGSTETFRVDFVTDLRGDPADGAGNYGTVANRDHVFDGHYTVNGASALFKSTTGTTVKITAFDDADGNNEVGDGVKDTITGITIAYFGIASAVIIPTTTATNYTVNGRVFTVTQNADNSVNVAGVAGDPGASLQGTVIAVFTATGYNSIEYAYQSGDTFQIGDFGATTLTNNPVNFTVPVQVIDGDGDVSANSDLSITANSVPPIALDLDNDGVEFVSLAANVSFDYHGDGSPERTAWVGADDGLLAIDRNGDGIVNDGSEIVFARDGLTDLQGLAADYDSNHDGFLTAADDSFALFGVWQDANSNGVTDAGEFRSLSDVGIVSIRLVSDGVAYSAANGQVSVAGQSVYTKADGTTGLVADAAFATGAAQTVASKSSDQLRTSNVTSSIVAASLVGLAATSVTANVDPEGAPLKMLTGTDAPTPDNMGSDAVTETNAGDTFTVSTAAIDPARVTGDVAGSLRAVDDSGSTNGLNHYPVSHSSDLLADSSNVVSIASILSVSAPIGGDMVLQNILDIAAANVKPASNDNLATTTVEDVVRGAMPDNMVDRLIEAFDADLGEPSVGSGIADNAGYLLQVINQSVTEFQDHSGIGIAPASPTFQDMMTLHNG